MFLPYIFIGNPMRMVLHTSDPTIDPQEDVVNEVTGAYSMYMINFINNDLIHVFTLNYHGESNENGPIHLGPHHGPPGGRCHFIF